MDDVLAQIVRDLAANDSIVEMATIGHGSRGLECHACGAIDYGGFDHDPECPFERARLWVQDNPT